MYAVNQHQLDLELGNRAASTRSWYRLVATRYADYVLREHLVRDPSDLTLEDLTMERARAFIAHIKETPAVSPRTGHTALRSSKTVFAHVKALKTFATYCFEQGLMPTNTLRSLKLPRVTERTVVPLTADQVKAIVHVVEHHAHKDRNLALVFFMLATGVRISELCGLTLTDLDLKGRRAKVLGKEAKERWVTFDGATEKVLRRYLAHRTESHRPEVFLTWDGNPVTDDGLRHLFRTWGHEAGFTAQGVRLTPHVLRHTFATAWLANHPGALLHLQALLGHTSIEMVRRYAQVAQAEPLQGPSVIERLELTKFARQYS
jgi:site-specific recombinase XerD